MKELKPSTYKAQSKQSLLGSYLTQMTPEQRDIAMKPMKKAKNKDTEDIPHEEDEGKVKIPDGPVDKPEEEHPHITL